MMKPSKNSEKPSKVNDNENECLAYERILLQSLIAPMSWTEPRFVNHLRERFVAPMARTLRDHDRTAADTGDDGGTLLPKSAKLTKELSANRVESIEMDEG